MVLVTLRHSASRSVWTGEFEKVEDLVTEIRNKLNINGQLKLLYRGRNLCGPGVPQVLEESRLHEVFNTPKRL